MALAKCPRCDKLFDRLGAAVCQKCQADEEADYDKVRDALEQRPNLTAEKVSKDAGVDHTCVARMIDQGLISFTSLLDAGVKCGMCGAPAISAAKKLCQRCLDKLNMRVTAAQSKIKLDAKKSANIGKLSGSVHAEFDEKRRT